MTSYLAANLAALRASGYQIPENPSLPEGWELKLDAPVPTLRIPGPSEGLVALHSGRDPNGEAARLVAAAAASAAAAGDAEATEHAIAIVAGAGLGFAVDALEKERPDLPVVLTDISFDRLLPALSRRDWTSRITKKQLGIFSPDTTTNAPGLRKLLEKHDGEPLVVLHPVLARDQAADLAATVAALKRAWTGARANHHARMMFEGPYAHQTLTNLAQLPRMVDVHTFEGLGRGRTALVTGAGPSLDRLLPKIKNHRDSLIIVAVDTSLRPLLAAGIDPDFVVAVDPSEVNARHLVDVGRESRAWFIGELSLPAAVFETFEGRVAAFRVGLNEPWPWLVKQQIDVGVLAAWGSVLVTAIDVACLLGCDKVLLGGADLAWTNNRPYCRGTTFGKDFEARGETEYDFAAIWMKSRAKDLIEVPDVNGEPTLTPSHFPAVRDAIVDLATKRKSHRVINVSGAGILAGGAIEQMDFVAAVRGATARDGEKKRTKFPHVNCDGLPKPREDEDEQWETLERALWAAWPHLLPRDAAGALAALRALVMADRSDRAGKSKDSTLAISDEPLLRWLTPLIDSAWTGEVLRFVQALSAIAPRWYEHLEPILARAWAAGEADRATYLRHALWLTRSAGDALYTPGVATFISRVHDRLAKSSDREPLDPAIDAERVLLLAGLGRIEEASTLLKGIREEVTRPLVTEALRELCNGARGAALTTGSARMAPIIAKTARAWADLDIVAERDTVATFSFVIRAAACAGENEAAKRALALGLRIHDGAMRTVCAGLAIEAWFSGNEEMTRELFSHATFSAAPAMPAVFQMATAEALFGDVVRARALFKRIREHMAAFLAPDSPPSARWFLTARAAAAIGDDELLKEASEGMLRYDPFARQRDAVAPPARAASQIAKGEVGQLLDPLVVVTRPG